MDSNGLLHLRARYYNPAAGVFTALDPFEGMWEEPMSLNGYSYVHGNPVNWTDPSGEIVPFIIAVAVGVPILVGVIGAAWNLFVEQGRGVGGANQFADSKCIDWGRVAQAGGAAAAGAVEAELGLIPPIGIAYGIGEIIKGIDPNSGWTPSEFNRTLLGYVGLTGAYDQLQSNPYYMAGRAGGTIASLAISAAAINTGLNSFSVTGGGSLLTSTGHTFGLVPVAVSGGQLVIGITGLAGTLAIAQDALRSIVFSIANQNGNQGNEPELPPKTIANERGATIEHYYRSGDHPPAHLHVKGEGPDTKIGQNGKPIDGSPELSGRQQQVVDNNKSAIRKAIDQIVRWLKFNNPE